MCKEVFSYINSAVTWLYFIFMATGNTIGFENKKYSYYVRAALITIGSKRLYCPQTWTDLEKVGTQVRDHGANSQKSGDIVPEVQPNCTKTCFVFATKAARSFGHLSFLSTSPIFETKDVNRCAFNEDSLTASRRIRTGLPYVALRRLSRRHKWQRHRLIYTRPTTSH